MLLSTLSLIILVNSLPFVDNLSNIMEVFNELTIVIACHINCVFLMSHESKQIYIRYKELLGWVVVVNLTFNLFINLIVVTVLSLIDNVKGLIEFYTNCRNYFKERKDIS